MTPLTLQLALPVVQLAGVAMVGRRISWRKHPALIAYLVSEALGTLLISAFPSLKTLWTCCVQIPVRTAVVLEVLTFARMPVKVPSLAVAGSLGLCAFAATLAPELKLIEKLYLFRQYYHLVLFAALLSVVIRRAIRPVLECARHRVYRLGVTAWLGVIAAASTFVNGGVGFRWVSHTPKTWGAVNTVTYGSLILVICVMIVAMVASLPKKIPAKVNKAISLRFTKRIAA